MNIFHKLQPGKAIACHARRPIWLLLCLLFASNHAHALDPERTLTQYIHDRWGTDRGFVGGAVFSICQSADGYLWIGTERGLVRFDGTTFTLLQRPVPAVAAIGPVRGLVSDSQGSMWIRLDGPHLLRYRNGRFEDAYVRFGLHELAFTAIALDQNGELLLWGPIGRFQRFRNERFSSYSIDPDIPGIVLSATQTTDQKLWLGTRDVGLFGIDQGRNTATWPQLSTTSINALLPANGRGLWIGTETGLKLWDGQHVEQPQSLAALDHAQILTLVGDREGNTWAGTDHGPTRITPSLAVSRELIETQANSDTTAIYEDHDGAIWFGGVHGLERLRDGMFTPFSAGKILSSENSGPVYVDAVGRTWFAPQAGGLFWMKDGQITPVQLAGLDKDVVYSISGGGNEIWLGRQHGGLTVLTQSGRSFSSRTYTRADGLASDSVYTVHRNHDGVVWAGTVHPGLSRLKDGHFTNYAASDGLASNAVFSIVEGYDGRTWFATANGLASFSQGHWENFGTQAGLPLTNIRSIFEDAEHFLWIATSGGLAMFRGGRIEVPSSLPDPLREEILGVTEDRQGSLWITTADHVLQVNRDRLVSGSLGDSDVLSYGIADGLISAAGVRRDRSIVTDALGRIWISLSRGLAMADPTFTAAHTLPATVRMESVSVGGVPYQSAALSKLPAATRSIEFNYVASTFSDPERVRFRYRLDGSDREWSRDVPLRQVVYTNLGPGHYVFRIQASNGMELWNGPETTVQFVVAPAFWQTWWFRLACVTAGVLIIFALYQWRMSQLAHRLNVRFQDRLAERTRIAQDLHDTLLQGVLSASLQLDLAEDKIPNDSPAKPLLRRVLQLMRQVTEEGRSALRGLRASDHEGFSLEGALSRLQHEFATGTETAFRVVAYGDPKSLRPMIRDDVYRIGREAVVNAFLHAQATHIEVEVEYAARYLRVWVRDDGCGMEPLVLEAGREGHWGLPGMRERSELIGSSLKLRSRVGAGTEVELTTPATVAFEAVASRRISRWLPGRRARMQTSATEEGKRATK